MEKLVQIIEQDLMRDVERLRRLGEKLASQEVWVGGQASQLIRTWEQTSMELSEAHRAALDLARNARRINEAIWEADQSGQQGISSPAGGTGQRSLPSGSFDQGGQGGRSRATGPMSFESTAKYATRESSPETSTRAPSNLSDESTTSTERTEGYEDRLWRYSRNIAFSSLQAGWSILATTKGDVRRDLRTYGQIINAVTGNSRGGWVKRMGRIADIIPARDARKAYFGMSPETMKRFTSGSLGVLVDTGIEFAAGEDYSTRGLVVAGTVALGTAMLTRAVPGVGTALLVNDLVQVAGNTTVMMLDATGQKELARKTEKVLEAIDTNRHIRQGAEFVVDKSAELFKKSKNILKLGNMFMK
ncbi:MAG: hypothetical protein Q9O62_12425 [Ardenticatenia bacterium]|nr:hypothetical protein [Ardenticatenia bacterium]